METIARAAARSATGGGEQAQDPGGGGRRPSVTEVTPPLPPDSPWGPGEPEGHDTATESTDHEVIFAGQEKEKGDAVGVERTQQWVTEQQAVTDEAQRMREKLERVKDLQLALYTILLNFCVRMEDEEEAGQDEHAGLVTFEIIQPLLAFRQTFDSEIMKSLLDYAKATPWGKQMSDRDKQHIDLVSEEDWIDGFAPHYDGIRFLHLILSNLMNELDPAEFQTQFSRENPELAVAMIDLADTVKNGADILGPENDINMDSYLEGQEDPHMGLLFNSLLRLAMKYLRRAEAAAKRETDFQSKLEDLEKCVEDLVNRVNNTDFDDDTRRHAHACALGYGVRLRDLDESLKQLAKSCDDTTVFLAKLLNIPIITVGSVAGLLAEIKRNAVIRQTTVTENWWLDPELSKKCNLTDVNIIQFPLDLATSDARLTNLRGVLKDVVKLTAAIGVKKITPTFKRGGRKVVGAAEPADSGPNLNLRPQFRPPASPARSEVSSIRVSLPPTNGGRGAQGGNPGGGGGGRRDPSPDPSEPSGGGGGHGGGDRWGPPPPRGHNGPQGPGNGGLGDGNRGGGGGGPPPPPGGGGGGRPEHHQRNRRDSDNQSRSSSTVSSDTKRAALTAQVRNLVEYAKTAHDDPDTAIEDLKQLREELQDIKKKVTSWEGSRGPLPLFQLFDDPDHVLYDPSRPMEPPMKHIRSIMAIVMRSIDATEEEKARNRKQEEANATAVSRAVGHIEIKKLTAKCDFLHYFHSIKQLEATAPIQDEDPRFVSLLTAPLAPVFLSQVGPSVSSCSLIIQKLTEYCMPGLVDNIMENKFEKLNKPGENRAVMVDNIATIDDYVRLIIEYCTLSRVRDTHLRIMETKCMGTRQMDDYVTRVRQWEESEDPQAILENRHGDAGLNISNQWHFLQADNNSLVNIENQRSKKSKMAVIEINYESKVSLIQRITFFMLYIRGLRTSLLKNVDEEALRKAAGGAKVAEKGEQKHLNQMSEGAQVEHCNYNGARRNDRRPEGRSEGRSEGRPEGKYEGRENRRQDGRGDGRRGGANGAKRTVYPKIKCAFESGCTIEHNGGSTYFCKNWGRLPDVRKVHELRHNQMCPMCLRKAHPPGIQCLFGPGGPHERKCANCGDPMHNERSGLCEGKRVEYQKNNIVEEEPGNEYLDFEEEEDDEEWNQENELVAGVALEPTGYQQYSYPLSNHANKELMYEDENHNIRIRPEVLKKIQAVFPQFRQKIAEARKTGKVEKMEEREYNGYTHQAMVAQAIPVPEETTTPLESAVKQLKIVAKQTGAEEDLTDLLHTKYPGAIAHKFRTVDTVSHLTVGPGSEERLLPMFRSIYRVAKGLRECFPLTLMGIIKTAILIENDEVFPDNKTDLPDSRIFVENGERFLETHALVDSGCSLSMGSKKLLEEMKPGKIARFKAVINTGNEPVHLDSFQFDIMFRARDGTKAKIPLVEMKDLVDQNCIAPMTKKVIKEEFKMSEEISQRVLWNSVRVVPQILLGLKETNSQERVINPLTLGLRPQLYSPALEIKSVNIMHGPEDLYITGCLGVETTSYSKMFNYPRFSVQQKNLDTGELQDWQKFDEGINLDVEDANKDYEFNCVGTYTENSYNLTEDPRDFEGEICTEKLKGEIMAGCYAMMEESDRDPDTMVDETVKEVLRVATEESMMSVAAVRAVEELVKVESGYLEPLPLCPDHREILQQASRHCKSCLRNADTKQEEYDALYDNILDNLTCEPDPDDPDKFILVQKLVQTQDPRLIGNLACSNFEAALRSSERVVNKTKNTEKLEVLDRQNASYLRTGKYGILTAEEMQAVLDGTIPSQFFCRGYVEKPDSASTPVRAVSDTSRPIWRLGQSLSTSNPAPRGHTSSLFDMTARFTGTPVYGSLDIAKVTNNNNNDNILTNILPQAYHSVHLDPSQKYLYLSIWFDNVCVDHTRYPVIYYNNVLDFGFGAAHVSLEGALLKFGLPACRLEKSKTCLSEETYVDNIGILAETYEELEEIKQDIVESLGKYNLECDKFFVHREKAADPDKVGDSTVLFGVIWDLKSDTIKPRTKLNIHGYKRGSPQGEDLPLTDLDKEYFSRRRHVRLLAELYDLLGSFYGPVLSQAKLLLRAVIKATPKDNIDLDLKDYSEELDKAVRDFWKSVANLQSDIKFRPRSAIPIGYNLSHMVVVHDAGLDMVASVVYLVSKNSEGQFYSQVYSSKCALRTSTVPKNEKASILQAVALAYQITSALHKTIEKRGDVKLFLVGDSTISSHMMSPDYIGDAESKNIAGKITAILTCISKMVPSMTSILTWLQGQCLTPADVMTKPYGGDIVGFMNSKTWVAGYEIYKDVDYLEKFSFFHYRNGEGVYRPLPEVLRKVKDPLVAEAMLQISEPDSAAPPPPPGPPAAACTDDLDSALYGSQLQAMTLQATDELEDPSDALATFYLATGGMKHTHAESAMVITRAGHSYQPPPATLKAPTEPEPAEDTTRPPVPPGFCYGQTKITSQDRFNSKVPHTPADENKNRAQRRQQLKKAKYPGNKEKTGFTYSLRLSADCYQETPLLPADTEDIPDLQPFATEEQYLKALERHEFLHASINVHTNLVKFVLKAKKQKFSTKQIYQAVWLKFLRSDQIYYEAKTKYNWNEKLGLWFNKYSVEDETVAKTLGSMNQPWLSERSPLLKKVVLSCHKEKHQTEAWETHHSVVTTAALASQRFFAVSFPGGKKFCGNLLRTCTGCLRGKSRFFRSVIGPRMAGLDNEAGIFETVSFDELGAVSISSYKGSRKMTRIHIIVFSCTSTGAIACVCTDSLTPEGIRRALRHLKVKTGCTVKNIVADAFPSHKKELLDPENALDSVRILDPRSQHQNFAERKIKDFKMIWQKGIRAQKGERTSAFGSWTLLDLQYLADLVALSVNLQPMSVDTHLSPAHLLQPGVFADICERMNALNVNSGDFSRRNVDAAVQTWAELIQTERNTALLRLQKEYEEKFYPVKKTDKTDREPELNDVVLVDVGGNGYKMGRIVSISENRTSAEVQMGRKTQAQAVKNLKVLSFYRK